MTLDHFVKENKKVIDLVKDKVPGRDDVDMYYGTLDYATARFNTVLIKYHKIKSLNNSMTKISKSVSTPYKTSIKMCNAIDFGHA